MANELVELKSAWKELSHQMEASTAWNQKQWREQKLDKTRSALRRMAVGPAFELVFDIILVLWIGSFLADHILSPRFALPALLLQIYALAGLAANIHQLVIIGQIDFAAPVVAIQRQLARLRVLRIRIMTGILMLAPLLWTPLLIVCVRDWLGLDIYLLFGAQWIFINLVIGMVFLSLALWVSHRFADRLRGSSFLKRIADDIAGRSLVKARGFVDEIARFQEEN